MTYTYWTFAKGKHVATIAAKSDDEALDLLPERHPLFFSIYGDNPTTRWGFAENFEQAANFYAAKIFNQ